MSTANERYLEKIRHEVGRQDLTSLNDGEGLTCHVGGKGDLPVEEVALSGYAIWPILLREYSPHYARSWYTLHPTLEAAAAYHDSQENPEDWSETWAIDLATDTEYMPETKTTFVKFERA